jgi:hypothetical protein
MEGYHDHHLPDEYGYHMHGDNFIGRDYHDISADDEGLRHYDHHEENEWLG